MNRQPFGAVLEQLRPVVRWILWRVQSLCFVVAVLLLGIVAFAIVGLLGVVLLERGLGDRASTDALLSATIAVLSLVTIYVTLLQLKNRLYTQLMDDDYLLHVVANGLGYLTVGGRFAPKLRVVWVRDPSFDDGALPPDRDLGRDEYGVDDPPIDLAAGGYELLYLRIKYNSGHPRRRESLLRPIFERFRWWIRLPAALRVVRPADDDSEPLPTPSQTSLYTGAPPEPDPMLVNPSEPPTYDNLAYGYMEEKVLVQHAHQLRGEAGYFGTGQNKRIHVPVWVETDPQAAVPKLPVPLLPLSADGEPSAVVQLPVPIWVPVERRMTVTINTPHFPHYQESHEFSVAFDPSRAPARAPD